MRSSALCSIEQIRNNLLQIEDMPYIHKSFKIGEPGCGDFHFWCVVQLKEEAILPLIQLLSDTTKSQVSFPNIGFRMTVGDLSEIALREIVQDLPYPNQLIIHSSNNGSWVDGIHFLQESLEHRKHYQELIRHWYEEHRNQLVWKTSNHFTSGDLMGEHPNQGHFELERIE